jgi:hypothetical protein
VGTFNDDDDDFAVKVSKKCIWFDLDSCKIAKRDIIFAGTHLAFCEAKGSRSIELSLGFVARKWFPMEYCLPKQAKKNRQPVNYALMHVLLNNLKESVFFPRSIINVALLLFDTVT